MANKTTTYTYVGGEILPFSGNSGIYLIDDQYIRSSLTYNDSIHDLSGVTSYFSYNISYMQKSLFTDSRSICIRLNELEDQLRQFISATEYDLTTDGGINVILSKSKISNSAGSVTITTKEGYYIGEIGIANDSESTCILTGEGFENNVFNTSQYNGPTTIQLNLSSIGGHVKLHVLPVQNSNITSFIITSENNKNKFLSPVYDTITLTAETAYIGEAIYKKHEWSLEGNNTEYFSYGDNNKENFVITSKNSTLEEQKINVKCLLSYQITSIHGIKQGNTLTRQNNYEITIPAGEITSECSLDKKSTLEKTVGPTEQLEIIVDKINSNCYGDSDTSKYSVQYKLVDKNGNDYSDDKIILSASKVSANAQGGIGGIYIIGQNYEKSDVTGYITYAINTNNHTINRTNPIQFTISAATVSFDIEKSKTSDKYTTNDTLNLFVKNISYTGYRHELSSIEFNEISSIDAYYLIDYKKEDGTPASNCDPENKMASIRFANYNTGAQTLKLKCIVTSHYEPNNKIKISKDIDITCIISGATYNYDNIIVKEDKTNGATITEKSGKYNVPNTGNYILSAELISTGYYISEGTVKHDAPEDNYNWIIDGDNTDFASIKKENGKFKLSINNTDTSNKSVTIRCTCDTQKHKGITKELKFDIAANEINYYWYVGQENPANLDESFNLETKKVTDNTSPGWRYLGSDLSVYNENNMIFEGAVKHTITFASRATAYIALPSSSIKLYDDTGYGEVLEDGWLNNPVVEKVINGVKYYIYTSNSSKLVAWGQDVY